MDAMRTREPSAARATVLLAAGAMCLLGADRLRLATARADEPQPKSQADAKPAVGGPGQSESVEYGLPRGWFGGSANGAYESGIDHTVLHGGKAAAFVRMVGAGEGDFGTLAQRILAQPYRGKRVRLSAYVKTQDAPAGAGLWMRIDGAGATLALDNMATRRVRGTADWRQVEVVLDVAEKAQVIVCGLIMFGSGKVWVDDFRIEFVGNDVASTNMLERELRADGAGSGGEGQPLNLDFEDGIGVPGPPALAVERAPLKDEQAKWLRASVIPFDTAEAGRGFADVQPLQAIIGDARIVALGEGTHGTREFFQMKHRLTEFLASELGFTLFAIEANMPEAYRVNEYVLTGKGDPRELLRGMYFWTWDTREVLEMILWMRRFNESGKGRIAFLGFDMQFGAVAMENARRFVAELDPEYAKSLDAAYKGLDEYWSTPDRMQAAMALPAIEKSARARRAWSVVAHLESSRAAYLRKADAERVDRAIQDSRVAAQAAGQVASGTGEYRDQSMAENVTWILDHAPRGSKIVLWAHNGHVARWPQGTMGSQLSRSYGAEMVVVGFAAHEGRYTAVRMGRGLIDSNELKPSLPGSLESRLHQTGLPRLALDLRKASRDAPESSWLRRPHDFRSIGALAMDRQFGPIVVPDAFDVLIYFDQTRASECFRIRATKP